MKSLDVQTHTHDQFVNITDQVQQAVREMGITEGVLTLFTPHTTCGLTINENADPDVVTDMLQQLDKMVPWRQPFYQHAEGNSAAHVKTALIGSSLSVFVASGHLQLGMWQGLYLCEFDGPRIRHVWLK